MGRWSEHFDKLVAGTTIVPPSAKNLELGTINEWKHGYARKDWPVNPRYFTATTLFGGYLSALADQMLALTSLTVLPDDQHVRTVSLRMDYFRPVSAGTLTIEGRLTHMSRRLLFVDVTFANQGELVAKADGSLCIVTFQSA